MQFRGSQVPRLSGSEYKIATYLYDRLEKTDLDGVRLTDEELSQATGVSQRQVGTVRKSLEKKGLVRSETVRGQGTCYRLPAASAAGLESSPPTAIQVPILVRRDAGETESQESSAPPGTLSGKEALPALAPEPPAAVTQKTAEPPPVQAIPVPGPAAPPATTEEQITALAAKMMDGQKPDLSFLQKLQEAAGGADQLLPCLQWMENQVDKNLGRKKYLKAFSKDDLHLFVVQVNWLCRSPESEFLKWQRSQKR